MRKIDLTKVEVYTSIEKKGTRVIDIKNDLANSIYTSATGIEYHSLAFKLYNTEQEVELSDNEIDLLLKFTSQVCTIAVDEGLQNLLKE